MERVTSLTEAKKIMGKNFIGPTEFATISDKMRIEIPLKVPEILFSSKELFEKRKDYILILGASKMKSGKPMSIKTLRELFGISSNILEPCFYNQDWYMNENFINICLHSRWYLIKQEVIMSTRAHPPKEILKKDICFPSAILTTYTFFAYYFARKEILWKNDFIWCSDFDHNGDRIYVGKYLDKINNNGFSIHRHLTLRNCYGAIDTY